MANEKFPYAVVKLIACTIETQDERALLVAATMRLTVRLDPDTLVFLVVKDFARR